MGAVISAMKITHKGPARISIDKGEPIEVVVELIASETSGRGYIWGPPNFATFKDGIAAQIFMPGFILPIMISGTRLSGPASFIVIGKPKQNF